MAARQRVSMRHRTCQEASLASCCPICELKFPSKCNFDPDEYEKVILKHVMKCSASKVKSAALSVPIATFVSNKTNPSSLTESGNAPSPFRSVSLSSSSTTPSINKPWASKVPRSHEKAGSPVVANMPCVSGVQHQFSNSPELSSRSECDKQDPFERTIIARNVQSFNPYQDCGDHWIDPMEQETLPGSRVSAPTTTSPAPVRDDVSRKKEVKKKREKRYAVTVPPKNIYKYTTGPIFIVDNKSHAQSPKTSRRRLKRNVKTHMEVCKGVTDVRGDDDYSAAEYSSISDSNSFSSSKPLKKFKSDQKYGKRRDQSVTVPNMDPNHFLNQSWWRKNTRQRTKKVVQAIPFDFQQCIVSVNTNMTKGGGETVNLNTKDVMKVARGSKRIRTQAKDQLKLCCPICQKEFKASLGIGQLTEEMMIRHVSKCSAKMFDDGVRLLATKPLDDKCPLRYPTKPESGCSVILGGPMKGRPRNIQKPVHLPSTEREDLATFHVMRAQSNRFVMHGAGKRGFVDMFLENIE